MVLTITHVNVRPGLLEISARQVGLMWFRVVHILFVYIYIHYFMTFMFICGCFVVFNFVNVITYHELSLERNLS